MKNKKQLLVENNNANLFDRDSRVGNHRHCVKVHPNSFEHELMKFKIAYDLIKNGSSILSESKVVNGACRVDLVDLSEGLVYEVAFSESEESLDKKEKLLPLPMERIRVPKELLDAIRTIRDYKIW